MPLVKREVQPIFLSRGFNVHLQGMTNELECVTNCTLSSVIRQLSNLARHAHNVFEELHTEADFVHEKSTKLQERIDTCMLSVTVTQPDLVLDQETLEGYMSQTPYHSTSNTDQVILDTLPLALQETRAMCDQVPALSLLDPYREDGKDALELYTNPKFFYELWCQEMQKNINKEEERRQNRRRQNRRRQRREQKEENTPRSPRMNRRTQNERKAKGIEFEIYHDVKASQSATSDSGNPVADIQVDKPSQEDHKPQSQSHENYSPSQDTYMKQEVQHKTIPDEGHSRPHNPETPTPPASLPPDNNNTYEKQASMTSQGQFDNFPYP
ncbi:actin-binding protein WASF1-like [Amphiura filiformis]|uniref:actin-binding protein WASF1-like n=1 Tax=Amphiura filiformis TaxID=82378 RepID=UPI003B2284F9